MGKNNKKRNDDYIQATGTCFDDVGQILGHLGGTRPGSIGRARIIHAICLLPEGTPYAHAWVEWDGFAWFSGIYKERRGIVRASIEEYRRKIRVQDLTAYSLEEFIQEGMKKDNTGPFKPEYMALTRDGKEASRQGQGEQQKG